jgi:hypothetical protein
VRSGLFDYDEPDIMSDIRVPKKIVYVFLALFACSLAAAGFLYGRVSGRHGDATVVPAQREAPTVLTGTIVRVEPLHVYVESADLGEKKVIDVLVDAQTAVVQLVAWGPGEKDAAMEDYRERVKLLDPKSGDRIPPPPQEMKLAPMRAEELKTGVSVGLLFSGDIDSDQGVYAVVIRPLTEKERSSGSVSDTFPL